MPGRTEIVIANPKFLAFLIFDCDNVFLKDFAIDYDPVPFTQGKVVAVDAAGGTFDLDIEPGYSLMTEPWFVDAPQPAPKLGHIMDAKARKLKPNAPDHMFVAAWAPVAGRVLRMTPPASYKGQPSCLAPGDHFVITARSPSGTVEFDHNQNGGMENVTLYAGRRSGGSSIGNEGALEFRHCSIRFKPGTTRLITANGDGLPAWQTARGRSSRTAISKVCPTTQ